MMCKKLCVLTKFIHIFIDAHWYCCFLYNVSRSNGFCSALPVFVFVLFRLYIKQPTSATSVSEEEEEEPEWVEYKIKETNMFTVDKYQQVRVALFISISQDTKFEFCDLSLKYLMTILISIISSLQIGFFPKERAFSLRYQTAGMLDTTLRQGVLGEDDTGEESPRLVSHVYWLLLMYKHFNAP